MIGVTEPPEHQIARPLDLQAESVHTKLLRINVLSHNFFLFAGLRNELYYNSC